MEYRTLNQEEVLPALHLVWDVFAQDVAPDYTPEGVSDFQDFIRYENICQLLNDQQLFLFGAVEKKEVFGVLAIRPDGMIRLFYVRKDRQGQGIGKQLFQLAYNFCVEELKVPKICVHAAPGAVQKYQRLGMLQTGDRQMENGKAFVPMEMAAVPGLVKPVETKKGHGPLIAAIVLGVVILVLIFVAGITLIRNLFSSAVSSNETPYGYGEEDPDYGFGGGDGSGNGGYDYGYGYGYDYGYDSGQDNGESSDSSGDSGIDAIPAYESNDLPYEIGEDSVEENGESMESTYVLFNITYPTVKGLSGDLDEKVNQLIKDCATKTMEEIYNNPSDEIKERVMEEQYAMLVSEVTYKICYANADILSIAFQDSYAAGNSDESNVSLRCLNINLQDGTVYTLTDLINVDETFEKAWLTDIRSEAGNSVFLSELSDEQLVEALKGETFGGVYTVNFFVDQNGMEIGFSLDYLTGDENDLGYYWVTAPFTFSEIEEYATENAFWKCLDQQ